MSIPWKFLTGLTSRRRPERDDTAKESTARTHSIEEISPASTVVDPAVERQIFHEQHPDEPGVAEGVTETPVAKPTELSYKRSIQEPKVQRIPRPKPIRGVRPLDDPAKIDIGLRQPTFDEQASAKTLDAEILQLRDQLAKKLRVQNAQLRQMLERFEVQ